MTCPECSSEQLRLLESRPTARGERRRRYTCDVCLHRWTEFSADKVRKRSFSFCRKNPTQRYLTHKEIVAILKSDLTITKLASEYNVPATTIAKIQRGTIYKAIYDQVCRPIETNANSCESCSNWSKERCGFGFPDAGGDFATDCVVYKPNAFADVVQ
jgi:transcriptional regulator NrdR family protein